MIISITRGHVSFEYEGRLGIIYGEGFPKEPGYVGEGHIDYVLYKNSFNNWEFPFNNEVLDNINKELVINLVINELQANGMKVEVE